MRPCTTARPVVLCIAIALASGPSVPTPAGTVLNCPEPPVGGEVVGASPDAVRPTQDVELPKLVSHVEPVYPTALRESRTEGKVILRVTVDVDGKVGDINILNCMLTQSGVEIDAEASKEGCASLSAAASSAVEEWRYEPAMQDGKPVCIYYVIRVDFRLGKPGEGPKKTI